MFHDHLPTLPRSALLLLAAFLPACGQPDPRHTAEADHAREPAAREVTFCSDLPDAERHASPPVRAVPVAEGLVVPWALDFAPDGRVFLTERPGRVRVVAQGVLADEPWAELDVYAEGEAGLLGIALSPDFETTGHVYVAGTFHVPGTERETESDLHPTIGRLFRQAATKPSAPPPGNARRSSSPSPEAEAPQRAGVEGRVYRFTERGGRGEDRTLIAGGIPAARLHVGAAVAFGPDGRLYVSSGDALAPTQAQDTASPAGAILRFGPNGAVPSDGSFGEASVIALGLRNVQGIDWHPETGELFAVDHGPSGLTIEDGRHAMDEVNLIVEGGNYGWPIEAGMPEEPRFIPPLAEWTPAIAPSGLAFYTGEEFPWSGDLFVGALRGEHLRRVVVEEAPEDDAGWTVVCEEVLLKGRFGRIRAVRMAPDGSLYFTTSNTDNRGRPAPGDDRLLRVVPAR